MPPPNPAGDDAHPGTKAALRLRLRARRRALAEAERAQAADRIAAHAPGLPGWRRGARLGAYRAADGEIDPEPLLRAAAAAGLVIHLPRIGPSSALHFHPWQPGEHLESNRYGIGEPVSAGAGLAAAALDLLLLPLVGFTEAGTRLGMGAGFYDRALAAGRAGLVVGLAFDQQQQDTLPRDPWDEPLDGILSESGWRRCY